MELPMIKTMLARFVKRYSFVFLSCTGEKGAIVLQFWLTVSWILCLLSSSCVFLSLARFSSLTQQSNHENSMPLAPFLLLLRLLICSQCILYLYTSIHSTCALSLLSRRSTPICVCHNCAWRCTSDCELLLFACVQISKLYVEQINLSL